MTEIDNSPSSGSIFAKVTRTINRPVSEVFNYIVPVDIPHIFPRQGAAHGVVANTVTTEWGTPGQQRVTTFDDDSTLDETLVSVVPDKSFSYLIENFTSPAMKGVVDRIEGTWEFSDNGNETTSIEWIYVLFPVSEKARSAVIEQLLPVYRDRLETAMTILKSDLEILGKTYPSSKRRQADHRYSISLHVGIFGGLRPRNVADVGAYSPYFTCERGRDGWRRGGRPDLDHGGSIATRSFAASITF